MALQEAQAWLLRLVPRKAGRPQGFARSAPPGAGRGWSDGVGPLIVIDAPREPHFWHLARCSSFASDKSGPLGPAAAARSDGSNRGEWPQARQARRIQCTPMWSPMCSGSHLKSAGLAFTGQEEPFELTKIVISERQLSDP